MVKTTQFAAPKYIGDPINAVKIFNEKETDELVILDIGVSRQRGAIDFSIIEDIVSEAFMPVAYGGGVTSTESAERLFSLGIEKVVLNSALQSGPELVRELSLVAGSQSVVVNVDVKRNIFGHNRVTFNRGRRGTRNDPKDWAQVLEANGAGEIIVHSLDREGTLSGYDLELIGAVSGAVGIPVVALGGARNLEDARDAIQEGAAAAAGGSMFVFSGKHRAVLITYPDPERIGKLLKSGTS